MKKEKIIEILKNFSYVIVSNFLTLIVSSVVILIMPKVIGVNEYGYWQLYTFYLTYIGFFHFGLCDGIYLKFGGYNYYSLDKKYFSKQIYGLFFFQSVISLISIIITIISTKNSDLLFIFLALSLNFVITNTRLLFIYVLQTTNRIKEASIITISDRFVYVIFILMLLLSQNVSFQNMIIADNIARFLSLIYAFHIGKDLTVLSDKKWFDVKESFDNIKVGSNLMLANIASSLIIGVIRFAIQKGWDIATFGKISLTLSLSNLVMIFINAIGIVVFPMLKRAKEEKLVSVYRSMRITLMISMLTLLLIYYPLKVILGIWIPAYKESLEFMGMVFPMIVFESKTSLLINTYLKAMRNEKIIFQVNVLATVVSLIVAVISVWLLHNLFLSVLSIVIILAFRSTLLEIKLAKLLKISVLREISLEFGIVLVFIVGNLLFGLTTSFLIYLIALGIYYALTINKDDIRKIKELKHG